MRRDGRTQPGDHRPNNKGLCFQDRALEAFGCRILLPFDDLNARIQLDLEVDVRDRNVLLKGR
jgi:hypothetical protein